MSEMLSAHELGRLVDCKVEGCQEPAAATRGVYARLCERHAKAKRGGRLAEIENGTPRRATGDHEAAIRAVLKAAEIAVQKVREAKEARKPLEIAYSDAVRAAGIGVPREGS